MDFMKVFDQAVREIKREVNLKVLKVPEIEQKVLDATNDESWGPHGTALQEIAQATQKFECQKIMDILWMRLRDSGPNWRHVYKALIVIDYLLANGSERAIDDIFEHTYQISALSGFEYVEPNGKDVGFNVRKKVETIMSIVNDTEKLQAVREKAASTRDKYIGLSSKAMAYKSSSTSSGSNSYRRDHYGRFSSSREGESFRNSYKEAGQHESESAGESHDTSGDHEWHKSKNSAASSARDQKSQPSNSLKQLNRSNVSPKSSSTLPSDANDDFDDFDPRGSSAIASANTSSNNVDLFGESLMGNLLDAPSIPIKSSSTDGATAEVDIFVDVDFQSAAPSGNLAARPDSQKNVDLFANQPAFPPISSNVDFFTAPDTSVPSVHDNNSSEPATTGTFDPFASIPLNIFDGSDPLSEFTSNKESVTVGPSQDSTNKSHKKMFETTTGMSNFGSFTSHPDQTTSGFHQQSTRSSIDLNPNPLAASVPAAKRDTFQVKSGIWADSLSRGLIDLNISASKKVNLADIGVVGGLDVATEKKEKRALPSFYMGRAMGTTGFASSTPTKGFTTLGEQQLGNHK